MNIGFLVPWPLNADLTSYWVMLASIATAVATIALAIFAVLAWRAALRTIQTQTISDQIAALAEYVKALDSLSRIEQFEIPGLNLGRYDVTSHANAIEAHAESIRERSHLVESSATIWRAHHKTVGGNMASFAEAECFLIDSIDWWRYPDQGIEEKHVDEQHNLWAEFAKEISRQAAHWQVNEKERQKTARHVEYKLDRYFHESPLIPENLSNYKVSQPSTELKPWQKRIRRAKRAWRVLIGKAW